MKKHKHNLISGHNDTIPSLRQTFRREKKIGYKSHMKSYGTLSLPFSELPRLQSVDTFQLITQLKTYLSQNSIHENFQSGFKSCHSTESVLLRVLNYVMLTTDSVQFTALPFDLVNRDILISSLEACVGLRAQYYSGLGNILPIGDMSSTLGLISPLRCI